MENWKRRESIGGRQIVAWQPGSAVRRLAVNALGPGHDYDRSGVRMDQDDNSGR
jgi:hypothetical protein